QAETGRPAQDACRRVYRFGTPRSWNVTALRRLISFAGSNPLSQFSGNGDGDVASRSAAGAALSHDDCDRLPPAAPGKLRHTKRPCVMLNGATVSRLKA